MQTAKTDAEKAQTVADHTFNAMMTAMTNKADKVSAVSSSMAIGTPAPSSQVPPPRPAAPVLPTAAAASSTMSLIDNKGVAVPKAFDLRKKDAVFKSWLSKFTKWATTAYPGIKGVAE